MVQGQISDRIAKTFEGSTIFLTGATGFVGKALLEKLLRVTNLRKVFLLIRKKKGISPDERLKIIFDNVLFKKLYEQKPDILKKCHVINGDCGQIDLGICNDERELVVRECDFIFHSAATTRFDDSLRTTIIMNTRGTLYMTNLAKQCKHLKLFIHISTAFAFPQEKFLHEKYYEPPANPHEVLASINWISDEAMEHIKKQLLGNIPNSYTFSKSLAEALVYEQIDSVPVIICRPAVVIPSFSDPFPGWFNNLQGPMGLFVGSGKGVIRSIYMDSKSNASLVPVDCTVSGLMVTAWYYLNTKNSPCIFNICVPECDIKISWEEIMNSGRDVINERVPFNAILWYPDGSMTKSRIKNKINVLIFQIIPALIIDLLLILLRYKPILYSIQMRIIKGIEMFEFYTTQAWQFQTKNIEMIRGELNEIEKKTYQLQSNKIDVKDYLSECILSARRYILKETDDMLPAAKRNMKIMFVVDRMIKITFLVVIGYYLYRLITKYLNM